NFAAPAAPGAPAGGSPPPMLGTCGSNMTRSTSDTPTQGTQALASETEDNGDPISAAPSNAHIITGEVVDQDIIKDGTRGLTFRDNKNHHGGAGALHLRDALSDNATGDDKILNSLGLVAESQSLRRDGSAASSSRRVLQLDEDSEEEDQRAQKQIHESLTEKGGTEESSSILNSAVGGDTSSATRSLIHPQTAGISTSGAPPGYTTYMVQQTCAIDTRQLFLFLRSWTISGFVCMCGHSIPMEFSMSDWLLNLAQSLPEAEVATIVRKSRSIFNAGLVSLAEFEVVVSRAVDHDAATSCSSENGILSRSESTSNIMDVL
ncbi:unnamed protein product, partial [Amoebophrya sp. A25]